MSKKQNRAETIRLRSMKVGEVAGLPPWEAEWTLFGPIPNEGNTTTWPGKIAFSPLPLDGAVTIPEQICILGRVIKARRERSVNGIFRFAELFGPQEGCPIVYMMTTIDSPRAARLPVSFGANWGTQWWVNGRVAYESRQGNYGDPEIRSGHQFYVPLKAGVNVITGKVVAGDAKWMITMGRLAPRSPAKAGTRGRKGKAEGVAHGRLSRDYVQTGLRIEARPGPVPVKTSVMRERAMARHHVQAHWIGIVDPTGSPYAESAVLPPGLLAKPGNAALLRRQVQESHKNGMAAMTWYPGVLCKSAAEAHPEWRSVVWRKREAGAAHPDQAIEGADDFNLCPNSPYGDALIGFVLESLEKYELDGFWIDGTCRSVEDAPRCVCDDCRRRFREAEGLDLPENPDWRDPVFKRWVAWRYRDYMAFWGRLAARVRCSFPSARIAINHLHRLGSGWGTSIPIEAHSADVVAASESADDPLVSAFSGRQQRAYGTAEAEVWMGLHKLFTRTSCWPAESQPVHRYMHHAMGVMTAGVMPSFGTPDPAETLAEAYDQLSALINPRSPYVGGVGEPYAGLHLSQQAETFHFSRRAGERYPKDYWHTVLGWHHLLMEKQCLLDLAFDSVILSNRLFAYPVFIAPYAVALSDEQVRRFEQYVQGGGVLVIDGSFGACDEWGEPADAKRVASVLGAAAVMPPAPDERLVNDAAEARLRKVGQGQILILRGNPGLAFFGNPSAALADEVGALVSRLAPPRLEIKGPRRLHVGLYRNRGRLALHLQNFYAYSAMESFPVPALTAPEPVKEVKVRLRGYRILRARRVLAAGQPSIRLKSRGDWQEFTLTDVHWGEVVELEM